MLTQSVVATDGSVSFVIFLYENISDVHVSPQLLENTHGFSGGDGYRGNATILPIIQERNVFRIDG